MKQVVIENPILSSPYTEPTRHFKFTHEGITNQIVSGRRRSSYFVPIAKARKKGKQFQIETEWAQDRIEETKLVNDLRPRVVQWRKGGYAGVTTSRLLVYWTDPEREKKLQKPVLPKAGKIAVKVINHYGGEVLKVFEV